MLDAKVVGEEWVNERYEDSEKDGEDAENCPGLLKQPEKFFKYFRLSQPHFITYLKK